MLPDHGTYLGTVLLEAHQIEKQQEGKMVTNKGNIFNCLSKTKKETYRTTMNGSYYLQFHLRQQVVASCSGKATGAETRLTHLPPHPDLLIRVSLSRISQPSSPALQKALCYFPSQTKSFQRIRDPIEHLFLIKKTRLKRKTSWLIST